MKCTKTTHVYVFTHNQLLSNMVYLQFVTHNLFERRLFRLLQNNILVETSDLSGKL